MTNPIKVSVAYADYDLDLTIKARGINFNPDSTPFSSYQRDALCTMMFNDLKTIIQHMATPEGLAELKNRMSYIYDGVRDEAHLSVKASTINRRINTA